MNQQKFPVETKRHSLAHLLAAAVLDLCPDAQIGIGPAIEDGSYYDFTLPESFKLTPEIVEQIEGQIKKLLKQDWAFEIY